MIYNLVEGNGGFSLDIYPETVEEAAQLMRLSAMGNIGKIEVKTSFSNKMYSNIWIKRKKGNAVPRTVTNGKLRSW